MSELSERVRAEKLAWAEPMLISLLEEAADALERMQWVSVEERLPRISRKEENDELLLVWCDGEPEFAFYDNEHSWDSPDKGWLEPSKVTHWMPLPEPPEVK